MTVEYLHLGDYLVIAEQVLGVPVETVRRLPGMALAESALAAPAAGFGDVEAYPELATKAAVLGLHLVKNHPLPDGNKRVALICVVMFVRLNGFDWEPPIGDADGEVTAAVIEGIAARGLDEAAVEAFAAWIADRMRPLR